jgi:hypothetical protein
VEGQILAAQGRADDAAQAFSDAIRILEACESRLELGRAHSQRALLRRALGEAEEAEADREAARALFEACGAARDLRRVEG